MAHDAHHTGHIDNVCLTGGVIIAAFLGGLTISAVIFIKTFWMH